MTYPSDRNMIETGRECGSHGSALARERQCSLCGATEWIRIPTLGTGPLEADQIDEERRRYGHTCIGPLAAGHVRAARAHAARGDMARAERQAALAVHFAAEISSCASDAALTRACAPLDAGPNGTA